MNSASQTSRRSRPARGRRRDRPDRDRHRGGDDRHRRASSTSASGIAAAGSRSSSASPTTANGPPACPAGSPSLRRRHRLAADRRLRDVLGHLDPHRQRPRRRAAGQPRPLLHPRRPLRHLQRRLLRDGPAAGEAQHGRDPDRPRLVGAARRRPDLRLRRLLADRLPARRHLAPALRPGRDPLGPDAPDADRRRGDDPGRDRSADGRGNAGKRRGREAAGRARPHQAGPRRRPHRRPDARPLHLPGRVRLRRPPVPADLPAADADGRRRRRPGPGARLRGSGRRPRRGRLLHPPARRSGAAGRSGPRPDHPPLPALSRRGGAGRGGRPLHLDPEDRCASGSPRESGSAPSASPPSGPGRTSGCRCPGPTPPSPKRRSSASPPPSPERRSAPGSAPISPPSRSSARRSCAAPRSAAPRSWRRWSPTASTPRPRKASAPGLRCTRWAAATAAKSKPRCG